jgi:hypothetical protein
VIGFNLVEAQIGDIVIKITHNGFVSKVQVWVKMQNEQHEWRTCMQFQQQFHLTTYLA